MYGDRVHQAVLENGEKKSGISIHRVSENYDEGDIVLQSEVRIDENETIESLRNKIQTEEYEHLPKLIESLLYPTG